MSTDANSPTLDLPQGDIDNIREYVPLVSIDLIIQDDDGRILLGLRENEPALGNWFVPGGRIRKDERYRDAFRRIVEKELGFSNGLGVSASFDDAWFLGCFEHHYNAEEHTRIVCSVHYVVLAFRLAATKTDTIQLPQAQHSKWRWFGVAELISNPNVHPNVKTYFEAPMIHKDQYPIVAAQRDSLNGLLWQTPVLGLTAQAFLFTIAFDPKLSSEYRIPSALLIILVAWASLQLMAKHRGYEVHSMKLLAEFESVTPGYGPVHDYQKAGFRLSPFVTPRSSYVTWIVLLWLFLAAGGLALGLCVRDWDKKGPNGSNAQVSPAY